MTLDITNTIVTVLALCLDLDLPSFAIITAPHALEKSGIVPVLHPDHGCCIGLSFWPFSNLPMQDVVFLTDYLSLDPAILICSLKSAQLGGIDEYTEGSSGDLAGSRRYVHPGNRIDAAHGLGAVETSPSQKATWDKATRYNNVSAGSSPPAQRKQSSIMDSPTWRRSGFVQESAGQPDPFVTRTPEQVSKSMSSPKSRPLSKAPANIRIYSVEENEVQFRPREDRAGLQIDGDNAQAVLPPNACVFVAK